MEGLQKVNRLFFSLIGHWCFLGALCLGMVLPFSSGLAKTVEVEGYGFLERYRMRNFLREIDVQPEDATFAPAFVEEGFFLLSARMRRDGYLAPRIHAGFILESGEAGQAEWDEGRASGLPCEPLVNVRFTIEEGLLFFYENWSISGLTAIEDTEAEAYFYPTGLVINRNSFRPYSASRFEAGQNRLIRRLHALGYRDAAIFVEGLDIDRSTGAVETTLRIVQGPRFRIREVTERLAPEAAEDDFAASLVELPRAGGEIFAADLDRELAAEARNRFLSEGYPDTTILSSFEVVEEGDEVLVDVHLSIQPGGRVRLGKVLFEGLDHTQQSYARSVLNSTEGDWLDRVEVERARYRLARLGIFSNVQYSIEDPVNGERDVVFVVEEDARHQFSLIGGWGSYERLRAGFEYSLFNIWGRAHRSDLKVLQTFKSSLGEYVYRVPFLRQAPISLNLRLAGLSREEISFRREEYTTGVGLDFRPTHSSNRFGILYRYQRLRSVFDETHERVGSEDSRVGSLTFEWSLDKRDYAISPKAGYRLAASLELATPSLGAESTYQRLLWKGSYHHELFPGAFLHLRLEQGALFSWNGDRETAPFNRRFLPGGENTIRGFREGEASPRGPEREVLGAEVYSLSTIEWEQTLTPSWSVVAFADALLESDNIKDYPGDTFLLSVGLGIRYSTPLGPFRLEYGRNVVRRNEDRSGALHLSLGFPF